jgi:GTP-binding protein HflX
MFERPRSGERAVLVRLGLGAPLDPEDLSEFTQLALSAGAVPVATITGRRERPDPRYFVGTGKAEQIRLEALATEADLILVDHPLSPGQERNLEKLTGKRVLDRSGLILDIFAQRARSHEGKLEVELAQLKHIASRLVRGWTHLERQRGGSIGLRGPGETQLETDRRLLAKRVRVLGDRLIKLKRQRETGRGARAAIPVPSVALVGYTNAGKSTLFRALSGDDQVYVADQLFATLDPTVRRLRLPGGTQVVVADTVGFIRDLPHDLVAAFESTLTEAREATLLLHLIDASDPRRGEHIAEVERVLAQIGAGQIPGIRVFNKIDRLEEAPRVDRDDQGVIQAIWISAATGQGLDLLGHAIAERLERTVRSARVQLPMAAGAARARLYAAGVVQGEHSGEAGFELDLELPQDELARLLALPGAKLVTPDGDTLKSAGTTHRLS